MDVSPTSQTERRCEGDIAPSDGYAGRAVSGVAPCRVLGDKQMVFGNSPTDLQQKILNTADRNPDMSAGQIASTCDCSASYVRETLDEFRSGPL